MSVFCRFCSRNKVAIHCQISPFSEGEACLQHADKANNNNSNNNNNILYSSQREIKAVVRPHNEEHISVILSHETHAHTHS